MLNRLLLLAGAVLMVGGSYLATTGDAFAHERREVAEYTFVIGFLNEPALLNQPNSLDLRISRTEDEAPIEGLEETLQVEVTAQGETMELNVTPRFNAPGAYNGHFMPTAEGTYTFRVSGTIEDNEVDETFTSGPGTFSEVNAPQGFPNPYTAPSADAGSGTGAGADLEQRIAALESDSGGGNGTTIGVIGIVIGALGLAAGGTALMRSGKA